MTPGAELQAPVFCHAFLNLDPGNTTISLNATELPWSTWGNGSDDPVKYCLGAGTTLIVLQGGMTVKGSAFSDTSINNWLTYIGIGSTTGKTPSANSAVVIASGNVLIPGGHDGVVMFMGKARGLAGDDAVNSGSAYFTLRLQIDGVGRGSSGVQEFRSPNLLSQRTLSCSYLSTSSPLSAGNHLVELIATVVPTSPGTKIDMAALARDLALIWFD